MQQEGARKLYRITAEGQSYLAANRAVIGSELVPAKVATARRNLADAGLADYADVREGNARQTLRDLGGPVDLILIDGWPLYEGPSLARQRPQLSDLHALSQKCRYIQVLAIDNRWFALLKTPARNRLRMSANKGAMHRDRDDLLVTLPRRPS